MANENANLVLYGHALNAGTRAVIALLKSKDIDCAMRFDDTSSDFQHELANINPKELMPVLIDDGFIVREEAAILLYLAQKHEWQGLMGKDIHTRAKVHQYLNFHDSSTKMYSSRVFLPYLVREFGYSGMPVNFSHDYLLQQALNGVVDSEDYKKESQLTAEIVSEQLEKDYFADGHSYLCADYMTLADIAAYSEIRMVIGAGLFSLDSYKKLSAWYDTMSKLPFFDEIYGIAENIRAPFDSDEKGAREALSRAVDECHRQLSLRPEA